MQRAACDAQHRGRRGASQTRGPGCSSHRDPGSAQQHALLRIAMPQRVQDAKLVARLTFAPALRKTVQRQHGLHQVAAEFRQPIAVGRLQLDEASLPEFG